MKQQATNYFQDRIQMTGLIFCMLSALFFFLPGFINYEFEGDSAFGFFFFNYFFSAGYVLVLLINGIIKFKRTNTSFKLNHAIILTVLMLISAFSLNREIPIFEESATWVSIFLIIQCFALIIYCFREYLPLWSIYLISFLAGLGLPFYIYYAIFLMPYYVFGVLGAIFLGISTHVFVPIYFLLILSVLIVREYNRNQKIIWTFSSGALLAVSSVLVFTYLWKIQNDEITLLSNENILNETSLPIWTKVSQQIPNNAITTKILKSGIVYTTPKDFRFEGMSLPSKSFDEVKKHDPFIVLANAFCKEPDLRDDDKIKILESVYDARHQAQDRLWSGKDLITSNLISNIKIFPKQRIAYTEKIVSIQNTNKRDRWRNQQEAIYTFHLSEGSVVSSLSLWINGKEEKGILTTKGKADTAYKTVVGVEARDPSLVHWQEGNTVSVRVFPCTPSENRRFKIGITSTLKKHQQELIYENIYFDGPSTDGLSESIQLSMHSPAKNLKLPFDFTKVAEDKYQLNHSYDADWSFSFESEDLSTTAFAFNGNQYTAKEYLKAYERFVPSKVFIDLNKSWSQDELERIYMKFKTQGLYYFVEEEEHELTAQNITEVYTQVSKLNFSLFPFYLLKNDSNALVISKSTYSSPNLKELKNSVFADKMNAYFQTKRDLKLFSIDDTLSPYLKTLKEFRVFRFDNGSIDDLLGLIDKQEFVKDAENDSTIVINNAGLVLQKTKSMQKSNQVDHLMRLYNYNDILKTISNTYFSSTADKDLAIEKSTRANIVTPVSSLIVLERKADYDRFGIKESENSLGNASMKSAGAVPEPHEWALIIIAAIMMLYFLIRN